MALFNKKKTEETKKEAVKAPATEKKGPSIHNVKVPAAKAETKPVETKPAPAKAPAASKVVAKPAPAKAAAPAAPAAKPAAPAKKAVPASKVPEGVTVVSRPFFMKTEEDVKLAFDQAIAEADAEIAKNGAKAVGKYEFELEVDGYHFYLVANNGQVLFDSPSFTTLVGALKGIETFKKTVAEGEFAIRSDKYDRYRFVLARKYYGENYTTKDQCQKCAESVKKFANNARIIRYTPTKEAVAAFEATKISKRTPDEIDWKAVEKLEASTPKMGKFEICKESDQYAFYLLANTGQILYSSRCYATEAACRKGIESFKRAAYVGNFFVDRDKFGNFRYVLKNIGSAPAFIGESYDNKPQCEKIIESVKKFIVSASIELEA
ncbi:MAG: YegP family protein [Clostridia bacterium]|nr:YegP family protein [Clostridia bacterium]